MASGDPRKIPVTAHVMEDWIPNPPEQAQPTPSGSFNTFDFQRWLLYVWHDRMPELRGIVNTQIDDIFGEGYGFDGPEAKVKKVKRFCMENDFAMKVKAVMRDYFIGGDGYLGVASVTESQALSLIDHTYSRTLQKSADLASKAEIVTLAKAMNPDLFSPSVLYALPGMSMRINYDIHGNIVSYVQKPFRGGTQVVSSTTNTADEEFSVLGGQGIPISVQYSPKEVIHFPYEPVGDSIYGLSAIQTCLNDVAAMWYAKNYGGTFFQNSAVPAYLFIMENESPESKNYKNFITELQKHRRNPHKNMVMTGGVKVERVSSENKDLEFGMFMDKFLQRILMCWGASARFSHLFTEKLETPANLESYYKRINNIQSEWEDKLNKELFDEFGVEFYFKRTYKRDESREADIATKLTNVVWTVNEAREFLGFRPLPDEQYDKLQVQPKKDFVSSSQAADRRTDQNIETETGPGKPKSVSKGDIVA